MVANSGHAMKFLPSIVPKVVRFVRLCRTIPTAEGLQIILDNDQLVQGTSLSGVASKACLGTGLHVFVNNSVTINRKNFSL
jgi:hypothetical protein